MVPIPAICPLGHIFPSGLIIENSEHFTIGGGIGATCPICGKIGHVLEGTYNAVGNTLEILKAPTITRNAIIKLKEILESAKSKGEGTERIKEEIEKQVPELKSIADILPKTRIELYSFLALIVAIVTAFLASQSQDRTTEIIINNIYQEQKTDTGSLKNKMHVPNVALNAECPCGSGKKFKRCHGINRNANKKGKRKK